MRNQITNSVTVCSTCQRNKRKTFKQFGHHPEKEAEAIPWDKMCIDLIGPYTIRRKGQKNLICKRVTQSPIIYSNTNANAIIHENTRQAMNYRVFSTGPDRTLWLRSMTNDLGRLAQGVGQPWPANQRIAGTNTMFFIHKCDVPSGRQVTYCKQEAFLRPTKAETHRVRNCAGGNCLDFPGPTATQTASLVTTKSYSTHHFYVQRTV
jgi:hypothetical protein